MALLFHKFNLTNMYKNFILLFMCLSTSIILVCQDKKISFSLFGGVAGPVGAVSGTVVIQVMKY